MCKESSRYSFESKGHEEGYKTSGESAYEKVLRKKSLRADLIPYVGCIKL